jgi:hypothetical protein
MLLILLTLLTPLVVQVPLEQLWLLPRLLLLLLVLLQCGKYYCGHYRYCYTAA